MQLNWKLLDKLAEKYGTAFFLFDWAKVAHNYQTLLAAFRRHYPATMLAYSYKTNYLPSLCRWINQKGGYAEVVSGMEHELALRVGVAPQKIIFNGPLKTLADMQKTLLGGSIVNLDDIYEVDLVEAVARQAPRAVLRVGLRCNLQTSPQISRFGFDPAGQAMPAALARLRKIQNCRVEGLHCHVLPEDRSAHAYLRIAKQMLSISRRFFPQQPPRFIDIGGGFCSRMPKKFQTQFPFAIPSFADYAQAIAPLFAKEFPADRQPELILEPGLALVADAMQFVCKVVAIKTIRHRTIALVTGSAQLIMPTKSRKNLPLRRIAAPQRKGKNFRAEQGMDIVGYTCLEDDCLFHSYRGALAEGDYLVFGNVGAYTFVLKPPFIRPAPAILAFSGKRSTMKVLRRAERFEDVFATYSFARN